MKHIAFIPDLLMTRITRLRPGAEGDIRSDVSRHHKDKSAHRCSTWLYEDLLA